MTLVENVKLVHVSCAFISIAGFGLRGLWMISNHPVLQQRAVKIIPHVIDTLLLGSAITLLLILHLSPLTQTWIIAKTVALLIYIGLGMIALRFGRTRKIRTGAWVLALIVAGYIVSVAYTKTPWGVFAAIAPQS